MIRRPELSLQRTKRSIVIAGHQTIIGLEAASWYSLKRSQPNTHGPSTKRHNWSVLPVTNAPARAELRIFGHSHNRIL